MQAMGTTRSVLLFQCFSTSRNHPPPPCFEPDNTGVNEDDETGDGTVPKVASDGRGEDVHVLKTGDVLMDRKIVIVSNTVSGSRAEMWGDNIVGIVSAANVISDRNGKKEDVPTISGVPMDNILAKVSTIASDSKKVDLGDIVFVTLYIVTPNFIAYRSKEEEDVSDIFLSLNRYIYRVSTRMCSKFSCLYLEAHFRCC